MPRVLAHRIAWLLLFGLSCAQAQSMDIKWRADGRYSNSVKVAAGSTFEFCGDLKTPQKLVWTFESSQPLDYSVHRADGASKRPAESTARNWRHKDTLDAPSPGRYCWAWSNNGGQTVELAFDVQQQAR